ncbi:hypothetical protein [Halorientalis halophila]|uniref:hypothetical protein n=1 Tax=Halorientalis halophila TaxID=3108499 RepID=UPI003008F74D
MVGRGVGSVLRGGFGALLRPHRFVELQTSSHGSTRGETVRQVATLLLVYAVNHSIVAILGVNLALPGGRPDGLAVGTITGEGQSVLALLVVGIGLYLFSLYLGARINHQTTRSSAFVVGSVAVTLTIP